MCNIEIDDLKIYLGTLFVIYVYNYINKIKIQTLYNCKLHNMLKWYYYDFIDKIVWLQFQLFYIIRTKLTFS